MNNTSDKPNSIYVENTLEDTINWSYGRISYWQTTSSGNLMINAYIFEFLNENDINNMKKT